LVAFEERVPQRRIAGAGPEPERCRGTSWSGPPACIRRGRVHHGLDDHTEGEFEKDSAVALEAGMLHFCRNGERAEATIGERAPQDCCVSCCEMSPF
jgi:hypothetical protein